MGDTHQNLDELLQALCLNLEALRDNGAQGFNCKPETLQKLENLSKILNETQNKLRRHTEMSGAETTVILASGAEIKTPAVSETLDDILADLGDCRRCGLCEKRHNIVFGVGNPKAKLVFVGEGPGHDEDMQGIPFVGAAGQLLTKIIGAMKLSREQVYICNVVKCRPPGNRNPAEDEIRACIPFLERQIAAIDPLIVVGLGGIAVQSLLDTNTGITRLRGKWTTYQGVKFMPTFHPSYLLRNPEKKREVWEDMQQVMNLYPYDQ